MSSNVNLTLGIVKENNVLALLAILTRDPAAASKGNGIGQTCVCVCVCLCVGFESHSLHTRCTSPLNR
jgi:hypothetical protein